LTANAYKRPTTNRRAAASPRKIRLLKDRWEGGRREQESESRFGTSSGRTSGFFFDNKGGCISKWWRKRRDNCTFCRRSTGRRKYSSIATRSAGATAPSR